MLNLEKNKNRKNVMRPEHAEGVITHTLGLVRNRTTKTLEIAGKTAEVRDVCVLLGRWVHIDGVDEVPFTSVTVNKNYAAARHRDENNAGPSLLSSSPLLSSPLLSPLLLSTPLLSLLLLSSSLLSSLGSSCPLPSSSPLLSFSSPLSSPLRPH